MSSMPREETAAVHTHVDIRLLPAGRAHFILEGQFGSGNGGLSNLVVAPSDLMGCKPGGCWSSEHMILKSLHLAEGLL